MNRRSLALGALLAALLLSLAAPAGAHVDVGPETAVAGSETTLTFSFRHGKDGSATTGLEVQLPAGATVLDVPAVVGWTSSVQGRTVAWTGGRVPDGTEARFPVVVRLPDEAGVALFPTVQSTEAGELAWISPNEGEGEDQQPAPRLSLTAAPAGSSTTASTVAATSSTLDLPRTMGEADLRDDGSNEDAGLWLAISGIGALVVVIAGGLFLKRRAG